MNQKEKPKQNEQESQEDFVWTDSDTGKTDAAHSSAAMAQQSKANPGKKKSTKTPSK